MIAERPEPIEATNPDWQQLLLEKDLEILRLQSRNQFLTQLQQLEKIRLKHPKGRFTELIGIGTGVYGKTVAEIDTNLRKERDSWE
ncbi:MAG: hypothetical protein RLZZ156_1757 [Deinococcota bacterium]|jgi:hypothetical protein